MQIFPHLPACGESAGGLRTFSDRWINRILLELLNEDVISSVSNSTWTLVTLTRRACGFQLPQNNSSCTWKCRGNFFSCDRRAELSPHRTVSKMKAVNVWIGFNPWFWKCGVNVCSHIPVLLGLTSSGCFWRVFVLLDMTHVPSALLEQQCWCSNFTFLQVQSKCRRIRLAVVAWNDGEAKSFLEAVTVWWRVQLGNRLQFLSSLQELCHSS